MLREEMMSNNEVTEIELNIKEAQEIVDLGKALDRLHNNRDFKKVILEGYFKNEAVRLVSIKGDPNLQSVDSQERIVKAIDAIGGLRGFFGTIDFKAEQAKQAIEEDEKELEFIRNGEDE